MVEVVPAVEPVAKAGPVIEMAFTFPATAGLTTTPGPLRMDVDGR